MLASIYIFVHDVFSMNFSYSWFKCMMIVYARGARDCPGYPGESVQFYGHVGGQHDVGENALQGLHSNISWALSMLA